MWSHNKGAVGGRTYLPTPFHPRRFPAFPPSQNPIYYRDHRVSGILPGKIPGWTEQRSSWIIVEIMTRPTIGDGLAGHADM